MIHFTPHASGSPPVIRFNCPHCDRRYELPEALARLALVCKGCGQPLAVPEASTAPELPPVLEPAPAKPVPPTTPPPAPPPLPKPALVAVATGESRLPPPDKAFTNGPPN